MRIDPRILFGESRRAVLARLLCIGTLWTFTVAATSCSTGDPDLVGGPTFVTDLTLRNAAGTVTQDFARGEPITLELTVRNRSNSEAILQFTTGQQSDFVVLDAGTTRKRWLWSFGKAFITASTETVFAPRETKTLRVEWDQVGNDGLPVGAGSYEARGVLLFGEFFTDPLAQHQLGSPLRPFTIR